MAQPDDVVSALARAYSLSDLFPVEDSRVRKEVVEAASAVDELVVLRVDGDGIRVGDDRIPDEDGTVGELARDLELAGVTEVHLPADLEAESLVAFVRSLREGAGSGEGERSARAFADALPGIGVAFADRGPARAGAGGAVEDLFSGEAAGGDAPGGSGPGGPGAGEGEPEPEEPEELDPEPEEPAVASASGSSAGGEEDATAAHATESGPERGGPSSTGSPPAEEDPAGFEALVDRFLTASPDERPELGARLRRLADEAGGEAIEERAEAVERIAVAASSGEVDRAVLEVARDLLTPPVAGRLAGRIGALREEERRDELVEATAELGPPMARAFTDALSDAEDRAARRTYIEAMVALGDDARPEVERMLDDSRWFVVRNGVRILGGIGRETDVEHLTSPLAHEDPRVRRETVMALGRIGGEDAGMLLLGMVDDPDPDVRAAVATALGALGVDRAVKVLLQRLEKEEAENAQIQIIRALGALGDPGAVQAIEKRAVGSFFSRPSTPVRVAAYRALASIGTPHAMELLEEARDDRDERVRNAARSLLDREREG